METFFGSEECRLAGAGCGGGQLCPGLFFDGLLSGAPADGTGHPGAGERQHGARNAGRVLGRRGFWLTMAGDMAKGALAVWLALALTGNDRVALLALLAVVAGHIWPAQIGFRGGKGVSTSLAGLLIYDWRLALIYVLFFLAALVLTRRSVAASLAGLCAAARGELFLAGLRRDASLGNFGSCRIDHPGASSERGGRDGGMVVPPGSGRAIRSICQRIMSTQTLCSSR